MVSTGVSELLCATSDEKPSIKIQYSTPEQLHSLARSISRLLDDPSYTPGSTTIMLRGNDVKTQTPQQIKR
jgi:hypothetical protein